MPSASTLPTARTSRSSRLCRATCFAVVGAALVIGLVGVGRGSTLGVASRESLERFRSRPNVLLISIDSLRADHVGAYGYPRATTPSIDWIAAGGVRFQQAIAPAPWTLPSHMTLLTSKSPREHGLQTGNARLAEDVKTLAAVFRDDGYATAGFVSGPYLSSRFGFANGFDHYDDHSIPQVSIVEAARGATSPALVGLVADWLDGWERHGAAQPFFIFLHMWDVHYDYDPPPPYDRMFDPDYDGEVDGRNFVRNPAIFREMAPRDLEHVIALYDGEIRFTDDHVGRILRILRRLRVLDDTIVVVTADHGDEFFEHGRTGHGLSLFDELIRVPLVIRYPRRVRPDRVDAQVRLADVGATLLGLARIAPPPGFGGSPDMPLVDRQRDLTPWITTRDGASRVPAIPAFAETRMLARLDLTAVRTEHGKLIVNHGSATYPPQFFDLGADPREKTNLVARLPERANALARIHDAWNASFTRPPDVIPLSIDEKTRKGLQALGYVEE